MYPNSLIPPTYIIPFSSDPRDLAIVGSFLLRGIVDHLFPSYLITRLSSFPK
jgi:hypothetical protein